MLDSKYNQKNGFSLLELILAIAFFSLGSVGIGAMLIDANLSTKISSERTEALFYAKEGIEATRSIRDNNWSDLADGDHGLVNNGTVWTFSGSSDLIADKYTRTVNVSTAATSTKDIAVTVSWELTSARLVSSVLETVLTDYK